MIHRYGILLKKSAQGLFLKHFFVTLLRHYIPWHYTKVNKSSLKIITKFNMQFCNISQHLYYYIDFPSSYVFCNSCFPEISPMHRTEIPVRYISIRASSAENSLQQYLSITAVSKGTPFSLGTSSSTSGVETWFYSLL